VPVRPRSILVVDDDAGILSFFHDVLVGAGYQVFLASDGDAAVGQCRKTPVDLLITDLMMPGREGIETIRYFRRQIPHTQIIAISGAAEPSLLTAAQILGATSVLQKPINPNALVHAVQAVIG